MPARTIADQSELTRLPFKFYDRSRTHLIHNKINSHDLDTMGYEFAIFTIVMNARYFYSKIYDQPRASVLTEHDSKSKLTE